MELKFKEFKIFSSKSRNTSSAKMGNKEELTGVPSKF